MKNVLNEYSKLHTQWLQEAKKMPAGDMREERLRGVQEFFNEMLKLSVALEESKPIIDIMARIEAKIIELTN